MGAEASSNASPGMGTKTVVYKQRLLFFPDVEQSETHTISSQYLEERLEELIDMGDMINLVALYKSPMNNVNDSSVVHFFVFFKTQGWWWTIEKDHEGVMMQRSKDMTDVLLQRAGENRNSPVLNVRWDDQKVVKANSRCSVRELIQVINSQDYLNLKYDTLKDVGFAAHVFNSTKCDGAVF